MPATAFCLIVISCAVPAPNPEIEPAPGPTASGPTASGTVYIIQRGDTLGDIARELTGDLMNWRHIAEHNGIMDPRKLRVGEVITIPAELQPPIPAQLHPLPDSATTMASDPTSDPVLAPVQDNAVVLPPAVPEISPEAGIALNEPADAPAYSIEQGAVFQTSLEPAASDTPAPQAIEPVPETVPPGTVEEPPAKQAAIVQPVIPPPAPTPEPASDADTSVAPVLHPAYAAWIVLKGSYYPREVKTAPDVGADTLVLAWPGTRFLYTQLADDWYKVVTTAGEGYVHLDDALAE